MSATLFDDLFDRRAAIVRHSTGPMLEERIQFLKYLANRKMARNTVRAAADYLLIICEELNLPERPLVPIETDEINRIATKWAKGRGRQAEDISPDAKRRFYSHATQWLRFLGRLKEQSVSPPPYSNFVDSFTDYLKRERGLSPWTISLRRWTVEDFLSRLYATNTPLSETRITTINGVLMAKIADARYARVSVRTYASSLRSFFHYAEMRGWCQSGLADGIKAARVFSQERLPAGPSWNDVQRLIATTEDEHPTNIRDRAILLLLATYGFRSREVVNLKLDDFDWERELLSVHRSKSRDAQVYPLSRTVGDAVLRYIKNARPSSNHRELFLTMVAPFRPLRSGLWRIVAARLRPLGVRLSHHGPHALRHACATYLLSKGFSLKEIGDHLGHHDPEATRTYAKVDLAGLRQIAEFDLGDCYESASIN